VRFLIVAPFPPQRDGIGIYARAQVGSLRSEGHVVTVLSPPEGGGDIRVPFIGGRGLARAARLARGADRVVVHFQPSVYFAPRRPVSKVLSSLGLLWLTARAGPKVEIVVHEADPPALWRPDYMLLRAAFRRAGTVSFHTRMEREALERNYRVGVRGRVIPHLAASGAQPSKQEARSRLRIGTGSGPVFVCAGFLQPSKGFDRAVEAFALADGAARLYVVGSVRTPTAENRAYARDLAARCRAVAGAELVEGFTSDAEFDLWLAAADWVVLPYRRAWSSGVLARAHVLGTPAIVSSVGGLPEQAGEKDVVVRDDRELAEALGRAAGAPRPLRSPRREGRTAGEVAHPGSHRHGGPIDTDWDPELEPAETKEGRSVLIGLILVSVVLAALAQLTLKHGMNQVTNHGEVPLALGRPVETIRRIGLNVSVWAGLLIFVLSASVWLIVLSRTSLSFAYPFASLTYVLILLFDRLVLQEPISALRYTGVALIIAGLVLISRTHQAA